MSKFSRGGEWLIIALAILNAGPVFAEALEAAPAAEDEIVMPEASVVDLGTLSDMDQLLAKVTEKQLVYVSESHDRYDHHLTQLTVLKAMFEKHPDVVLAMEYFFQPFQAVLDRYISGEIDEVAFIKQSEYFDRWRFDYRLYRPIFRFAREKGIPMIALNIPREITTKVAKGGIESLTEDEQQQIPQEIDHDNERYSQQLNDIFKQHPRTDKRTFDFFMQAQLVWDEGMAERAAEHFKANPDGHMVLLAGTGHLAYRMGIPDRLERRTPVTSAVLINSGGDYVSKDLGDYLVVTKPQRIKRHGLLGLFLDTDDGAPKVIKFSKESGAEKAGIAVEDKIVALNGKPVESYGDLKIILLDKRAGDEIEVKVQRKSLFSSHRELDFNVVLK